MGWHPLSYQCLCSLLIYTSCLGLWLTGVFMIHAVFPGSHLLVQKQLQASLTALIPDSCWESCSRMAMMMGCLYSGERKSSAIDTFLSMSILLFSSFISAKSSLTSSRPVSRLRPEQKIAHVCSVSIDAALGVTGPM